MTVLYKYMMFWLLSPAFLFPFDPYQCLLSSLVVLFPSKIHDFWFCLVTHWLNGGYEVLWALDWNFPLESGGVTCGSKPESNDYSSWICPEQILQQWGAFPFTALPCSTHNWGWAQVQIRCRLPQLLWVPWLCPCPEDGILQPLSLFWLLGSFCLLSPKPKRGLHTSFV